MWADRSTRQFWRRRRGAAVAALLCSVSLTAGAQQTPTFRASANIIAVEAAVTDKSGRPITSLSAADFTIVENGQPQPVQTMYLVSSDPNFVRTGKFADDSASAANTSTAGGTGSAAASGEVVRRELRGRVMVFVFDLNHLGADGYKRSKAAVESFLKSGAQQGDMIGVVAGATMLNNRIDSDRAALLKAMEKMPGPNVSRYNDLRSWPRLIDEAEAVAIARGNDETTARVVLRACAERPDECSSKGGDEPVRQQIEGKARQTAAEVQRYTALSLNMLLTMANSLGRFPGNKHVLVFSDGFYTGEQREWLKNVTTLAARNNVRFSTLDARGLSRDPRTQSFMNEQPLQAAGDLSPLSSDENSDVLSSLAIDTGGEVIMNRNDLRPGIDIVSRASSAYYVLGYSPVTPMDGNYHSLSVKVNRPDVTIRARKGYIATPVPVGSSSSTTPTASADVATPATPAAATTAGNTGTSAAATSAPTIPLETLPRFRPNSDKNVASLTTLAPSDNSSEAKSLAAAGWDAYALGDVGLAQQKLSQAVATGKAAPWVSYALGFSQYALGQFQAAIASWTTVRATVPEFMPVYFDIADGYLSLGKTGEALTILRDAAKRWPTEPEPQNALGTQLVKRGALDDAIDVFGAITRAKPQDSLGFFNLGRAYHLRYLRLQQNVAASRLRGPNGIGDDDRKKAIAAYTHYLTLGGPFEKEAKDALALLDWKLTN